MAHRLPYSYLGRKLASLLLGPAGGRQHRPYDVDVFATQKARLHPSDNICEKRVFLTPQHWDPSERAYLASVIAAHASKTFYFLDVGANAGLYTLFARAIAGKNNIPFKAICVEPNPLMVDRLKFNIGASNASSDIQLMPYAATAENGAINFAGNADNLGMSHLEKDGDITVQGRTLFDILTEVSVPHIDALKIDIEGHEFPTLSAFFRRAPEYLWPAHAIVEVEHEQSPSSASDLFLSRNYREVLSTRMNKVFARNKAE